MQIKMISKRVKNADEFAVIKKCHDLCLNKHTKSHTNVLNFSFNAYIRKSNQGVIHFNIYLIKLIFEIIL